MSHLQRDKRKLQSSGQIGLEIGLGHQLLDLGEV